MLGLDQRGRKSTARSLSVSAFVEVAVGEDAAVEDVVVSASRPAAGSADRPPHAVAPNAISAAIAAPQRRPESRLDWRAVAWVLA